MVKSMVKNNLLLINTNSPVNRVALVENGNLTELYIDRKKIMSHVGNIYKGKILRVIPGMQAAFVDIGMEKAAFIYVTDVVGGRIPDKIRLYLLEREDNEEEMEEDAELDFDFSDEELEQISMPKIEELISAGDEILVQVAKEPIGSKGARVTGYISLPGRHLVYMPYVDHIGISRKINDEVERERLKQIVEEIRPDDTGFIVRTACIGSTRENMIADRDYLLKLWENIKTKWNKIKFPSLIYSELDLVLRCVRDLMTSDIDKCIVDSFYHFREVKDFVRTFMPKYINAVEEYNGDEFLFDKYDIEHQIDQTLNEKVWLKSGGYLVIERTEALTSIDVNTGSYLGQHNLEETITQINMEAAREIPLQLRLRNIGGLIVIDFIDMESVESREKVLQVFSEISLQDRARHMILPINEFGLMEVTRQRKRESLLKTMTRSCDYCQGRGYIKSFDRISSEIIRDLFKKAPKVGEDVLKLKCNLEIADYLTHNYQKWLDKITEKCGKEIDIKAVDKYHVEKYELYS